MYCVNCGTELKGAPNFCRNCGADCRGGASPTVVVTAPSVFERINRAMLNVYVFFGTIALLLIIRFTVQESEEVRSSWGRDYVTEYFVPGNMQVVMVLLLAISAYIMLRLCGASTGKKRVASVVMLLAELLFGLVIIYVRF